MLIPYSCAPGEQQRLDALRRLNLLDTPPVDALDRITRMAAELFKLPIAAISLTDTDRQWFKSRVGVEHCSIPRENAPCAQVAETSEVLVVPDLAADACYHDSLLAASGIRFYAGAPLVTQDGHCLGALCVLGSEARQVTAGEAAALRDLATMVMAQIELRHALGRIDPQSGLPNRLQFIEDFQDLNLDRPHGEQRLAALVNLGSPEELGAVRVIGSAVFDEIVDDAVRLMKTTFGLSGAVYHVGATGFVFLAPSGTDTDAFCAELAQWVERRAASTTSRFVITARIGVAPFQVRVTTHEELLRDLHSAVQQAFDEDHGVTMYSSERDAAYRRRFWLVNEFGAALDAATGGGASQLRLVYQPKVDLATGAGTGAEALLRWIHPEAGDVPPGEFIPVIERTALIRATTNWVLEAAMRQLAAWRADGLFIPLAVNVSAVNVLEPDFCARVVAGLRRHGLPPDSLVLEITESALMQNPALAMATLRALDAAGVRLAIDDFGTGYSSLAYLQSLPAQVVKIDRSFVCDIEHDARRRALVQAMIKLSHDLGHRVVAEGVETPDVVELLREAGCDEAQGYLYAKPLEPGAFVQWFALRGEMALA
jgi:EAL domain-containing protein (putative c-di-GMP-specific phosphodiesterase class I)/GAF domain-containing protein